MVVYFALILANKRTPLQRAASDIIWESRRDGSVVQMQSPENFRIIVLKNSKNFQGKNPWWCIFS